MRQAVSPVLPESEKKVQRSGSRTGGDGVILRGWDLHEVGKGR